MLGGASTGSEKVDQVFLFITALSVAFLLSITAVMIYFVIRYRRSRGAKAQDIEGHTGLEITWTLVPLGLFLTMFYYGWTNYQYLRRVPRDAMVIKVVARQWAWSFVYPDGRQTTELSLAVNRPVKLELESLDVIHGFYIPAFRVKEDVVPGKHNYTWFQPTELGSFDIECTVICGVDHSYMLSKVHVLTEDAFKSWYFAAPGEQVAELSAAPARATGAAAPDPVRGAQRFKLKGCVACHTDDGAPLLGPTLKGAYGKQVAVLTDGRERMAVVDDGFIANKIRHPQADVVKGYRPEMTALDVSDQDIAHIIAYLKTLK
jgi:cytochrome c oxidase subunit 2